MLYTQVKTAFFFQTANFQPIFIGQTVVLIKCKIHIDILFVVILPKKCKWEQDNFDRTCLIILRLIDAVHLHYTL